MRIVIDGRTIADHFPGIGRYTYNLIRSLATLESPHEFAVICNQQLRNTRYDLAALARMHRVKLLPSAARPFSLGEHAHIPLLLRRARADLYHAPYYVRPYAALPCPSVVTLYDAIPRLFPAEVSSRARLLFNMLTRLAIYSSNHVLTISQSARADLARAYRVAPERMTVTPLAADERFRPQPPDMIKLLRAKYRLPERYVLTLASNKPHKNLPLLLRAWAGALPQLPRANVPSLIIAGHWDPRYPEAREISTRLGLDMHVRFLEEVANDDLAALYAGAELFVFPSRYEGFGLPPLEAMACGTAVICGDRSSLPEVVGDAALKVDVTNVAEMTQAIVRLLGDAALRAELQKRALEQAARFSWQHTAKLTLAVYEQVAGKG